MNDIIKKPKYNQAEILRLRQQGKTYKEISEQVGCAVSWVHRVCVRKLKDSYTWINANYVPVPHDRAVLVTLKNKTTGLKIVTIVNGKQIRLTDNVFTTNHDLYCTAWRDVPEPYNR